MSRISISFCLFILISLAQQSLGAACEPPKPVFNTNAENIFTDEQEMILGEAVFEQIANDFTILRDPEIAGPIEKIGQKLVRFLPKTGITYKFHVVDMPETNAFITPGGNVFLTKKLIALAQNEDELAGVVAHELGHGVVHHSAIDISKAFKELLNVTSVGDRADIFKKYNEYIDNRARQRSRSGGHVGDQQIEADNIGLYAMTASGYDPDAFATFFDRLTESEGETGGWFADFVGKTRPAQKRLREIIEVIKELPAECREAREPLSASDFETWQTAVLLYKPKVDSFDDTSVKKRVSLNPMLRDEINQLAFSPNGNYILARDESTVFVIEREPYKVLFRIDIDNVRVSQFSADSNSVLILTRDLRYERWNIKTQKPEVISELYIRAGCQDQTLSPRGDILACYHQSGSIRFYNLRTKQIIFEKENFYKVSAREANLVAFRGRATFQNQEMNFSPSGRYFIASKLGSVFRFAASRNQSNFSRNKDGYFGYDFVENKEIRIPGSIKSIISLPFAFLSDTEIVGQDRKDEKKSGIFDFPSGKRKEQFTIKGNSISTPFKGKYILVRPIKVAPVGVYDLESKKFLVANLRSALAVHGTSFVSENKDGILGIYQLNKEGTLGQLELPASRLGSLRTVNVSPDFNWIAISDSARGGIWSLFDGGRYSYTTGFGGAFFDRTGKVYLDILKTKETVRQIGVFDLRNKAMTAGGPVDKPRTNQYGNLLVTRDYERRRAKSGPGSILGMFRGITILDSSIAPGNKGKLVVDDVRTRETLWSREFKESVPGLSVSELHNTMTFVWPLGNDEVKPLIAGNAALKRAASKRVDSRTDYYVQVVDASTGEPKGGMVVETGRRSFRVERVSSSGDWGIVFDSANRVQLYSLETGELVHRFFGNNAAVSPVTPRIAVGNSDGEVSVYDTSTGKRLKRINFGKQISYVQFDKYGKKLLVLTNDQKVVILDATKIVPKTKIASVN